jgi:hypothetical protein
VAQLGARFHGMEEVVGSIPTRSTMSSTISDIALARHYGLPANRLSVAHRTKASLIRNDEVNSKATFLEPEHNFC